MSQPIPYASKGTDKDTPQPVNPTARVAIFFGLMALPVSFLVVVMGGMSGGLFFLALHAITLAALISGSIAIFKTIHRKMAIVGMSLPVIALLALYLFWAGGDPVPRLTNLRVATSKATLVSVQASLKQFQLDNTRLPTTAEGLQALLQSPPSLERTWHGPYIPADSIEDAWGQPLIYRNPSKSNPAGYDLFSTGRDGLPDTSDDVKIP